MTTDTGTTNSERGNVKFKVERKPARPEALPYEVMLSPFSTLQEAELYIEKYQHYYPIEDRNYTIKQTFNGLNVT
jgi:hypothetical protein